MATLTLLLVLALPGSAFAERGCAVLREPGERAECEARASAREAARAEVAARTSDAPTAQSSSSESKGSAWSAAMAEAAGPDLGDVLEPRPLAAIVGTAWFVIGVRRRWSQHRRQRSPRAAS